MMSVANLCVFVVKKKKLNMFFFLEFYLRGSYG